MSKLCFCLAYILRELYTMGSGKEKIFFLLSCLHLLITIEGVVGITIVPAALYLLAFPKKTSETIYLDSEVFSHTLFYNNSALSFMHARLHGWR